MTKVFQLLLVLLPATAFAQIKSTILDGTTKDPIPYVNISVQGEKNIEFSADENGSFTLPEVNASAKIVLSAVGYANTTLGISEIKETILLIPKTIELAEVVIGNKKGEHSFVVNPVKKVKKTWFGFSGGNSGVLMFATYIPYKPEYEGTPFLDKIHFRVQANQKNTFNVRLYTVNTDGSPGDYLYGENILVTVTPKQKSAIVDFSKNMIRIPEEGLFVVMETIAIKENRLGNNQDDKFPIHLYPYGPGFLCEMSKEPQGWYYKEGQWKRYPKTDKGYARCVIELTLTD
jgi:hypothetical protein